MVLGVLMVFQAYMAEYAKSDASTSFLWGDSHDGRNFLVLLASGREQHDASALHMRIRNRLLNHKTSAD